VLLRVADASMPENVKKRRHRYGLTHVESKELTLRCRRCGKGFVYLDAKGTVLSDQTHADSVEGRELGCRIACTHKSRYPPSGSRGFRALARPRLASLGSVLARRSGRRVLGWSLSALSPKADIRQRIEHVCFVPLADLRPVF